LSAALAYPLLRPRLERAFAGHYPAHEAWRQGLLEQRLAGTGTFLWLAFAALALFCLVLVRADAANALAAKLSRAGPFVAAAGALLAAGLAFYFSTREWVRLGRPCWDNYCTYAEMLSKWLAGQPVERRLLAFMREDYHANSPMGPLLIACVRLLTGLDTVTCYRIAVALATLASALLLWRVLLRLVGAPREAAAAALALFGTHLIVVRSSCFPQTDAFVLLWTTGLLVVAALRARAPRPWHAPVCLLLLASGLLVKLSFLPALLLLPAFRLASALAERRRPPLRLLAADVLLFSLLPLLLYLLAQWRLGLLQQYRAEFRAIAGSDSHPAFVATAFLHAAGLLLPLAWLGRRRFAATEAGLLAWTLLYLVSLWLSRASGFDRFYLAVLPPLAALAAHGLENVRARLGSGPLWAGVLLAASLNYAALWLGLYY
jgi:hypothetical protein